MKHTAGSSSTSGLKIYDEARTAHLERAGHEAVPARLLYRKASYDFDRRAAQEVGAIQVSARGAAWRVFESDGRWVELNEPFFLRALPLMVASLIGGKLRLLRGGRRPRFVTYAIENIDMALKLSSHSRLPTPLLRLTLGRILRWAFASYDRVAFGTLAAKQAYEDLLGPLPRRVETAIFPAVEPACSQCDCAKVPGTVIFVGAFDERKGVSHLMAAWPEVVRAVPGARLAIIGKGAMTDRVQAWANRRSDVVVQIDPPRRAIHEGLSRSNVLVLPSISSARWREQVGLPIVEALSHGCAVVTTRETGLCEWLEDHGHTIVDDPTDARSLSRAIAGALLKNPGGEAILETLPLLSGRMQAEEWLWRD
ncbi:glycosyltransferase family 4 protein [Novosphingobium sp. BL-52-GroH]|uniref:glycosyltransferase family 4 protein n=1 Tax=Novosphingobium sp. BL-52-GroH TaxID=3349877 RepID=UPI00384C6C81